MITVKESNIVKRFKCGYDIREELWDVDGDEVNVRAAYTPEGDYIGDNKLANMLCKVRGIKPQKINKSYSACTIGFCEKDQTWYGWSHRAIYAFGVGFKVEKGSLLYKGATPQDLYDQYTAIDENGYFDFRKEDVKMTATGIRVTSHSGYESKYKYIKCGKGEYTAETLEDAKKMAIAYARAVS